VALDDDLTRIAEAALAHAQPGETVSAVIPTEPETGVRVYLCAFDGPEASWLALDAGGQAVRSRTLVRDAVSIAAMCEVAEESAGGGDLETLREELANLRRAENPSGIDEAEAALDALARVLGEPPRIASPAYLDELGAATRELEHALGSSLGSPFADAMRTAMGAVEELKLAVEGGYKLPFD